jgi:hypothetical protein
MPPSVTPTPPGTGKEPGEQGYDGVDEDEVAQGEVHAEGPDTGAECQSEEQLGNQVAAVELEELARRPQHLQGVARLA